MRAGIERGVVAPCDPDRIVDLVLVVLDGTIVASLARVGSATATIDELWRTVLAPLAARGGRGRAGGRGRGSRPRGRLRDRRDRDRRCRDRSPRRDRVGVAVTSLGLGLIYVAAGRRNGASVAARGTFEVGAVVLQALRLVG